MFKAGTALVVVIMPENVDLLVATARRGISFLEVGLNNWTSGLDFELKYLVGPFEDGTRLPRTLREKLRNDNFQVLDLGKNSPTLAALLESTVLQRCSRLVVLRCTNVYTSGRSLSRLIRLLGEYPTNTMLSVCGNDKVVAIAAYSDTLTGIANSNLVQAAVRDIWDHLCALPSLNIPNRKLSESVSGSAYLELDIELLGSEIVAAYDHFASAENIADGGAVSSVLGQLWESRVRRAFEVTGKYRLTPPERPIRQRVNVLFIGLRGTRRSGGDRTLENIASGLDHSQFGLVLAVPDKVGSLADHWRAQNLNVMEFDYGRVGLHVQSEHLPAWQLADDDRVAESDLVFANNLYVNRIAATVARRLNVPLITRIISLTTHEELFANLAFEASLVVVPSAFMAKHCSDLGIPSSQIRIVHEAVAFGLDTSERKKGAFRSNLGISGDKQIIGVAARWDEQYKGLDTILLTAKLVTAARNDVHFAILGGTSRHSLPPHWARKLSSILSIEANVHFTGHLDSVEDAYREMSVLLHPAESEPFGLAVTEAMWFAIPVVASNTGGVPEQITNGVDGVLVDQRTPQNYASALLGLLGDPEARIRLGHAGQRRARQFYSLDRFSSEVSQLINDLVSQRA